LIPKQNVKLKMFYLFHVIKVVVFGSIYYSLFDA